MKKPFALFLLSLLLLAGCAAKPCLVKEEVSTQLNIHVLADGSIGEILLAKSSGIEALDKKALEMMKGAHAQPAEDAGVPVDSWVTKTFVFEKVPEAIPSK